ncbi:uncharacterized protein LOC110769271 isoform X2 [Prunus avium]|uniref:Uncharacterized protein LOC110769271 isoform X2 n=1 Tax=Prunus avium TaxID=42229 RepID=A0A6P5TPH9_PRUAV|nr:uncharacterized protein LOC110769271 isoform X2 [Prunus avium]
MGLQEMDTREKAYIKIKVMLLLLSLPLQKCFKSSLPLWGITTIEKDAPLSLVIDIIIEQGLFQSRYEIQAFRLESTAHGTGAPVDELQVQGVSSRSDLRKIFSSLVLVKTAFSLQ